MEGSALSERDLMRARAESAHAILLFADRFSPSALNEDLNLQFQVRSDLRGYGRRRQAGTKGTHAAHWQLADVAWVSAMPANAEVVAMRP